MNPHPNHLTEEEIATCSEAMSNGNYDQLEEEIRKHIDKCSQCAGEVMMVHELTMELPEIVLPQKKPVQWWPYVTMAAAVAVILIVINIPGVLKNEKNTETRFTQTTSDSGKIKQIADNQVTEINTSVQADNAASKTSTEKAAPDQKLTLSREALAIYNSNETFEKLIDNMQTSYRGNELSVLTKSVINFPETDSILWENPQHHPLTIEWYNNKGALIETIHSTSHGTAIPHLENGLYYWKLLNDEFDLLGAGKVVVTR